MVNNKGDKQDTKKLTWGLVAAAVIIVVLFFGFVSPRLGPWRQQLADGDNDLSSGRDGGSLNGGPGGAATEKPGADTAPQLDAAQGVPATELGLELVAQGFNSPIHLESPPDGSGRRFIVDRIGTIHVLLADGTLLAEPFLDLRNRVVPLRPDYDERGLLGFTFHPEFAENGRVFVHYSAPLRPGAPAGWDHTGRIAEFVVPEAGGNKADAGSERILLEVDQPQANHNGGTLAFGPDGYLYVGLGDGGGSNDKGIGHPAEGNGQDVTTLLGSILRLDADNPRSAPPDNPFVAGGGRPEIYAWGLRNPYRFSFDRGGEGHLFVADVGQDLWEEVNIVTAPGNFGWPVKEGSHWLDRSNARRVIGSGPDSDAAGRPFIDPVIEYRHPGVTGSTTVSEAAGVYLDELQSLRREGALSDTPAAAGATTDEELDAARGWDAVEGISIIGGYVYRGQALTGWQGKYVFGDWSNSFRRGRGKIFVATATEAPDGPWAIKEMLTLQQFLLGFGEDAAGELYVLTTDETGPTGTTGKVYKIVPAGEN